MWQIDITDVAEIALLNLDRAVRMRVLAFLRERVALAEDPKVLAEPLYGEFRGLWRFRVGDYRIICDLQTAVRVVEVLDVNHRSRAYRKSGR